MSTETITIRGVDPTLLNSQRLALAAHMMEQGSAMPTSLYEALDGILNMLDAWSDDRRVDLPEKHSHWFPKDEGTVYPKGAITVIGWSDHNRFIHFARDGYCQVYKAEVDDFLARFRRVTDEERATPVPPELAYFCFDDGPMILGFTYGDRWNGWGLPYVEKESFRRWIEASGEMFDPEYSHFKFDGDTLINHDPMAAEDNQPVDQVVEPTELAFEGKNYVVYHVGNGWCWNQYDLATSAAVDFSVGDDPFPPVFIPDGLEEHHMGFLARQFLTRGEEQE